MRRMIPTDEWNKLSDETKALLEGFSSDDASTKKIYCHPITLEKNAADGSPISMRLACLVFNNDSTPFTLSSFIDWIKELGEALGISRILCCGGYYSGTAAISASFIYYVSNTESFGLAGMQSNGTIPSIYTPTWTDIFPSGTSLVDAVNAIN